MPEMTRARRLASLERIKNRFYMPSKSSFSKNHFERLASTPVLKKIPAE
jgi:hypothetical protein